MGIGVLGTGMVGRSIAAKLVELVHDKMVGALDVTALLARTEADSYGNLPCAARRQANPNIKLGTFAQAALAHKNAVQNRFHEHAEEASHANPMRLADQLLMLMDGAFLAVRLFGADNPGRHVAIAAQSLLDTAERAK